VSRHHRPVPPIDELAAALHEHAAGSLADTAAVNLVIAHGSGCAGVTSSNSFFSPAPATPPAP